MNTSLHRKRLAITLAMISVLVLSCAGPGSPTPLPPADIPTQTPVPAETAAGSEEATATVEQPTAAPSATPTVQVDTPTPPVPAAALVNGQIIELQAYEQQVAQAVESLTQQQVLEPETEEGELALAQLRRQILDAMIDQVLIEQAATEVGIAISDEEVDAEMARLIGDDVAKFEEWLTANGLTREGFRTQLRQQLLTAAFQEHVVGSEAPQVEQAHARHILVATESEAMDLLLRLRAGEGFAELARQYSQDQGSSEAGGDLGHFPRGVMPVQIEAVAFALAPGQMSGVVQTDFGYHIVEVLEKDPSREIPEDMLPVWRQNMFMRWLEAERPTADIVNLIPTD
jgi:parvulin-like peptidyl-prolyl isomerase